MARVCSEHAQQTWSTFKYLFGVVTLSHAEHEVNVNSACSSDCVLHSIRVCLLSTTA